MFSDFMQHFQERLTVTRPITFTLTIRITPIHKEQVVLHRALHMRETMPWRRYAKDGATANVGGPSAPSPEPQTRKTNCEMRFCSALQDVCVSKNSIINRFPRLVAVTEEPCPGCSRLCGTR